MLRLARKYKSLADLFQQQASAFTSFEEIEKVTHTTVMKKEVTSCFEGFDNKLILDMTFGMGGHSKSLLEKYPNCKILAVDQDSNSTKVANQLQKEYPTRFAFRKSNYQNITETHEKSKFSHIRPSGVIFDLGFCSSQIDDPLRGFSLMKNGPLDMRYCNLTQKLTAAQLINFASVDDLEVIFRVYGDERHSRKIASAIETCRMIQPIISTYELSGVIARTLGATRPAEEDAARQLVRSKEHLHVATKVFQAVRIFVNDELNALYRTLKQLENLLEKDARVAILVFHAIEDAVVKFALGNFDLGHPAHQEEFAEALRHLRTMKNSFKIWRSTNEAGFLSKLHEVEEPVWKFQKMKNANGENRTFLLPTQQEVMNNARSRSAKLRLVTKIS